MTEARKLCIEKRQQLYDLDDKREKLQQDLYNAEANLQELHATQVKLMTSQLEGKKRQKLDYDLQLQKKKAAIEEAQRQYEELKLQLGSEMTTVQAEIDNLTVLATLSKSIPSPEQQRAANSPTMVEALAATDLPSMSSGNSDDSIGEHLNKANKIVFHDKV